VEAAVEAALRYNCEHVVPQSWFGKAEPMRHVNRPSDPVRTFCTSVKSGPNGPPRAPPTQKGNTTAHNGSHA
jgi:hypothetical protein